MATRRAGPPRAHRGTSSERAIRDRATSGVPAAATGPVRGGGPVGPRHRSGRERGARRGAPRRRRRPPAGTRGPAGRRRLHRVGAAGVARGGRPGRDRHAGPADGRRRAAAVTGGPARWVPYLGVRVAVRVAAVWAFAVLAEIAFTVSDILGAPVAQVVNPAVVRSFLFDIPQGRALVVQPAGRPGGGPARPVGGHEPGSHPRCRAGAGRAGTTGADRALGIGRQPRARGGEPAGARAGRVPVGRRPDGAGVGGRAGWRAAVRGAPVLRPGRLVLRGRRGLGRGQRRCPARRSFGAAARPRRTAAWCSPRRSPCWRSAAFG